MTKIYGLFDPRNDELRYVGKTVGKLNLPFNRHMNEKWKNHKSSWIKQLKSLELKPYIELLDEVSDNEWVFWEQWYIEYFKSIGCNLTNQSKGGEGTLGFYPSKDTRYKMSIRKKGIKQSWKHKFPESFKNKFKKIIDIDYLNIKELYKDGLTMQEIANDFNVTKQAIWYILRKNNFKK